MVVTVTVPTVSSVPCAYPVEVEGGVEAQAGPAADAHVRGGFQERAVGGVRDHVAGFDQGVGADEAPGGGD